MHGTHDYLAGLAQIHTRESVEERRALWRQGLARLGSGGFRSATHAARRPGHRASAEQSCAWLLSSGLLDDMSFLHGPWPWLRFSSWQGLCPPGPEKRRAGPAGVDGPARGRRGHIRDPREPRLLWPSPRALGGALVRARVALSLRLPIARGTGADTLALALISRSELEREWLTAHSLGALPSRRLAGRLLERAAREAARRAEEGDDSGVRVSSARRFAQRGAGSSAIASRWCGVTWPPRVACWRSRAHARRRD